MKIAIGSDHEGFELKGRLLEYMRSKGYQVEDLGAYSPEPSDYPLISFKVSQRIAQGEFDRGVLICTTGIGMAIAANKVNGIRAGVCQSVEEARYSRQHNDTNVLVLGAKFIDEKKAMAVLDTWLETDFETGGRHERRVNQIKKIEREQSK